MKILQFLFCRYYQFMVKVGNGDIGVLTSLLLITILITINLATLDAVIYSFTEYKLRIFPITKINTLFLVIAVFAILYFLLVKNGKSNKILNQYGGESRNQKIRGISKALFYLVLSLLCLFLSWYFMMKRNRGEL